MLINFPVSINDKPINPIAGHPYGSVMFMVLFSTWFLAQYISSYVCQHKLLNHLCFEFFTCEAKAVILPVSEGDESPQAFKAVPSMQQTYQQLGRKYNLGGFGGRQLSLGMWLNNKAIELFIESGNGSSGKQWRQLPVRLTFLCPIMPCIRLGHKFQHLFILYKTPLRLCQERCLHGKSNIVKGFENHCNSFPTRYGIYTFIRFKI